MNKIIQIKIFNDILDQFFNYLETNFPLFKSDLVLSKTTVNFVRNNNPRLIVEQFMYYISPYKKEIYNCNENFFLNFEKNLVKSELNTDNILLGMKIKNMWQSQNITDMQKANIWLFFQKLIKAGELI